MIEYGKTQNLFARNAETHELDYHVYRMPEARLVGDGNWIATEKIDGTNVRVICSRPYGGFAEDRFEVELRGRSDRAQLPGDVQTPAIGDLALASLYNCLELPDDVVVTFYGELYGGSIQKMSQVYGPEKRIAIFDVRTSRRVDCQGCETVDWTHRWLNWNDVQRACALVSLDTVPLVFPDATIDELVVLVPGMETRIRGGEGGPAEGIVARTDPYIYTSYGERVIFKLKARDLQSR